MKTIDSMINEAQSKLDLWLEIENDEQALIDRCKTKEQALCLANYFEGVLDGLNEANRIL